MPGRLRRSPVVSADEPLGRPSCASPVNPMECALQPLEFWPVESTSAPWVILVINVNIYLVGLMVYLMNFGQVQQWRGMDKRMWNPFKKLRTRIGKSPRLFIFILVIQDHIESMGKPILLKGDEVVLNGLLAQSA